MTENEIAKVVDAAFQLHTALGPSLESSTRYRSNQGLLAPFARCFSSTSFQKAHQRPDGLGRI